MGIQIFLFQTKEIFLKIKIGLLFFLFLHQSTNGQIVSILNDTSFQKNSTKFITNYTKNLNIHNFGQSTFQNYMTGNFSYYLNNQFNSNIIFSTTRNIRDENYFKILGLNRFSKIFGIGFSTESKRINDNREIGISRFKDFNLKGFILLQPLDGLQFIPNYGYKAEELFEIDENGPTYGFETRLDQILGRTKITGYTNLNYDKLNVRRNNFINTEFTLDGNISNSTLTNTIVSFNKLGRDYYTTIDSNTASLYNIKYNIENREDNFFNFSQKLYFKVNEDFDINLSSNLYFRNVNKRLKYKNFTQPSRNFFDSRVNEFRFLINLETRLEFEALTNIIKLNYGERSEKHSIERLTGLPDFLYYQRLDEELQKNNFSSRTTLATQNYLYLFEKDTLKLEASISKLKYDTPSLENFTNPSSIIRDDRDELLYIIRIQYTKFFNPLLFTDFQLESYNNHLVYIFKERSSNNNWNRVIRLSANTVYSNSNLVTKNYFEVLANYTIYDFEDIFQTTRSFAFRQFSFRDSTRLNLSKDFSLHSFYSIKLSEQGILNWKAFSSIPGRFLDEQIGEFKLAYNISELNLSALGIRFTSFIEYNYIGKEKQILYEIKSIGPMIETILFYKNDFFLNLKGWIEFISQSKAEKRRNINFSFNSQIWF